ncbi:MAG TPA: homoserine kinase [Propionibacteriaceae bacterium]|nr:homoserine kinase [Propionibacteriaceae bacterium]
MVRVRVPATSANLGPGFDAMGLALAWYDEVSVELISSGVVVDVTGEGASDVPRDASHLVVSSMAAGFAAWGRPMPGIHLRAHNSIPHSRGLGSSAAAIVAGLTLAWAVAHPGVPLDRAEILRLATIAEGHPDNAAAAVHGGVVLAWSDAGRADCVILDAHADLEVVAFVPDHEVPTRGARAILPTDVPRLEAVAQATSAALLVEALTRHPEHLLIATRDWLHQPYRAHLMVDSARLMASLREAGVPAVISGAGPAVLAIGTPDQLDITADTSGFTVIRSTLGDGVEVLDAD